MKIVGIDPGLKATGFSFIEQNGRNVELSEIGTIKPQAQATIAIKLQDIYQSLNHLINAHSPEVLVLEKIYSHVKHPTTIGVLGHVRGVICLLCAQRNLTFAEYSVKRVRKAITGNGNATKAQTQKIVMNLLKIEGSTLSLDASDSLALALGYVYMNKRIL